MIGANLVQIQQFLEAVWGDQEGNVVIGRMSQAGPRGELNRTRDFKYPEHLDAIVRFVEEHSNEDVYASPLIYGDMRTETGMLRRIPENAISAQVAYQDSDTCGPENFLLRPSIHVESSAGRYQDYWMLDEPVTAEEAATFSRKISVAHRDQGSDPSSWSANKYLRIPGTTNTRHGFPEIVTGEMTGTIYSSFDMEEAYGDIELTQRPIARVIDRYVDSDHDLPDYAAALDKIPADDFVRLEIEKLTTTQPVDGKRSEMRYRMLCNLFRVGSLTFEEVLAIAWRAPASAKWREDARNLRGLIMEAEKAQTEVAYEKGRGAEPAQAGELATMEVVREVPDVKLLSDDERDQAAMVNHFVRRYEAWSSSKLGPAHNGPYCRMNAWTILSAGFSGLGMLPNGDGLNLYGMAIGDSGSGKTSSKNLYDKVMSELFHEDQGYNIGSNASPDALQAKLIERDGKVSVFSADEAHGWFRRVNGQQWAEGTYEMLAEYYDGKVPPVLRTSKQDISGKSAKTHFLIHLMGTMKGEMSITNVLTRSMFFSGFLARFTWYIGEERVVTEESLQETNGDGEFAQMGYEPMARQWAAEFQNTAKMMRAKHKRRAIPMNMTQGALARLSRMKWEAREIARERGDWDILEPCLIRIGPNTRRAASLLALEAGRDLVEEIDVICAIEQSEEWLSNLFFMAERVSESEWKRQTDEVEEFIVGKGGKVLYELVMRKFASRRQRDLQEQILSLQVQGRIMEVSTETRKYLKLNDGTTKE